MKRATIALLVLNGAVVAFSLTGTAATLVWPVENWDFSRLAMVLGIINILTGFGVSFLHMAAAQGWRRLSLLLGLCLVIGGGAELLSTVTGIPFGRYEYTDQLGPKFLGRVPYLITLAWFMMFYPSLHIAFLFRIPRGLVAAVAAAILTLWDLVLEAAMTTGFACWEWQQDGLVYGIPLQNWIGWFLTGWLIGTIYSICTRDWRSGSSALPVALYIVQSLFAAVLAMLYGRGLATAVWAVGLVSLLAVLYWRSRSLLEARSVETA